MKRLTTIALACALFGAATLSAYAGDEHHHHAAAAAQKSYAAQGEVAAVDKAAGRVKLKHEAVPELQWPAMTMFFAVANKAQLGGLKAGDKIKFEFIETADGAPLITQIRQAK